MQKCTATTSGVGWARRAARACTRTSLTFVGFAPKDVRDLFEGAHGARHEAGGGQECGAEGEKRGEEHFAADVTRSSSRKGSPASLNI